MAKKKTDKGLLIRGIRIYEDTIYTVGPKQPSEGAPEIYRTMGSEKASSPYGVIANKVGFPASGGAWDTGLYPTSAVFREMGLSPEEAEIKAKENIKFIVEPLKKAGQGKMVENLLNHEDLDNEWFLNMSIPLMDGVQFNTGDAKSRLALYAAIISGELAPSGKASKEDKELGCLDEDDYVYSLAQYTITSESANRSVKEKREYANNRARGIMINLLESDKALLVSLANYEGVNISEMDDDFAISRMMSKYFEPFDNVESFLETYELYKSDDKFKDSLEIMGILLNHKGLNYLEKSGKSYYLGATDLGMTVKSVARTIANSPRLKKEFMQKIEI